MENIANNNKKIYDTLIVGGGPAGLNAAIYSKRKGNNSAIITVSTGGQVSETKHIKNFLGKTHILGPDLVEEFKAHINDLEIPVMEYVGLDKIESKDNLHFLHLTNGDVLKSKTAIIAMGSKPRKLGVKGEDEFTGLGVSYCAICDAPLYRGKDVIIAGGGDAAVEAAIDVAKICNTVSLVHRNKINADKELVNELKNHDNINVYENTAIQEISGDEFVNGVVVQNRKNKEVFKIDAEGVFIEAGSVTNIPNTKIFEGILELNEKKEIVVDKKCRTNVAGIYAAGDITNNPYNQIITAASEGATAALAANEYLNTFTE